MRVRVPEHREVADRGEREAQRELAGWCDACAELLTDRGIELWSVIFPLMSWGARHFATGLPLRTFRHAKCGTEIDAASRCPACGTLDVPPADIEIHPGPGATDHPRHDPVSLALRTGPHRLLQPVL